MKTDRERIKRFIRHLKLFREQLEGDIPEEEPFEVSLSTSEMCVIVYGLGMLWLGEVAMPGDGTDKILDRIAEASQTLMAAEMDREVDGVIESILGRANPETEGDGA